MNIAILVVLGLVILAILINIYLGVKRDLANLDFDYASVIVVALFLFFAYCVAEAAILWYTVKIAGS